VANAISGTVSVIDLATGQIIRALTVGTEPMAVCLSPNATRLYVANSGSDSVQVFDTNNNDLLLATVQVTPTGRSPRAIAVTNDGDSTDTDEKVYVPMFFARFRGDRTTLVKNGRDEGQDDSREGVVAIIDASTNALGTVDVTLRHMDDTGFRSNGSVLDFTGTTLGLTQSFAPFAPDETDPANPVTFTTVTGAWPNQLASIAIHPTNKKAYVVGTAASPNGPFRFNSNMHGMVSVFGVAPDPELEMRLADVPGNTIFQEAPLNLNRGIGNDTATLPRLFLSNPAAIAWRPSGSEAWIAIQHTDLLVRMTVDTAGIPTINAPEASGGAAITRIDLQGSPTTGQFNTKAPQGLVINNSGNRAYVMNFVSRTVSVVDLDARAVLSVAQSAALPPAGTADATVQSGAELFFSGRGPGSPGRMSSEGWGACIACHPGGLADGATWMFPAGPRQTIPLDGMFARSNPSNQRILNWSALRDENHDFELNTRNVSGGRGLIEDDRKLYVFFGSLGPDTPVPEDSPSQIREYTAGGTVALSTIDTNNTQVSPAAALPIIAAGRRDFGITTLPDGRVYAIGGRTGAGAGTPVIAAEAVLEFDPFTNSTRFRSSTGFTPRFSLGVATVNTTSGARIYAIGGWAAAAGAAQTTVQVYDPSTDTWTTATSLPVGTAEFGVCTVNAANTAFPEDEIQVVGGNTAAEGAAVALTGVVRQFRHSAQTWTTGPTLATARRLLGAAPAIRLVTPFVFAFGGYDGAGTALASIESYSATNGTLTATPITPLAFRLADFGITTAQNRIYIAGGVIDNATTRTVTSSIIEYNPLFNPPAPGTPGAAGTPAGAVSPVSGTNSGQPLAAARRGVGISSPPPVANFTPVGNAFRDTRQDSIAEWIKFRVRSAVAPNRGSTSAAVTAGRTLFGTVGLSAAGVSCATCHGGPKWTRSTVDYVPPPTPSRGFGLQEIVGAELRRTASQPNAVSDPASGVLIVVGTYNAAVLSVGGTRGNFVISQNVTPSTFGDNYNLNEVRFDLGDPGSRIRSLGFNGFNIPSLLSVHQTAPYFHHGAAEVLVEVLDGTWDGNFFDGIDAPFRTVHNLIAAGRSDADISNLIEFLRSIDETTPIFP
jgi:YVTN family beta-propeller protein